MAAVNGGHSRNIQHSCLLQVLLYPQQFLWEEENEAANSARRWRMPAARKKSWRRQGSINKNHCSSSDFLKS